MKKWFVFWSVISFLDAQEPDAKSLEERARSPLATGIPNDVEPLENSQPLSQYIAASAPVETRNQGREAPDRNLLTPHAAMVISLDVGLTAIVSAFLAVSSSSIAIEVPQPFQIQPIPQPIENNIAEDFQTPTKPPPSVFPQEPSTHTEQFAENGFNTTYENSYKQYSETFRELENPWENVGVIDQKEKIGRQLFLSAMDLKDDAEKAPLIKLSADLGVATACLYHYEGIKGGKYGFKVDPAELQSLRTRYANVKLKELQHIMVKDQLDSFNRRGAPVAYLNTLLEYLQSGNETAIYEYLDILREKEHITSHGTGENFFAMAKMAPPHASLQDAIKHYLTCGSEAAFEFLLKQGLSSFPGFPLYWRGPRSEGAIKICRDINPQFLQTELYRDAWIKDLGGTYGDKLQNANSEEWVRASLSEYIKAGSEVARDFFLNAMKTAFVMASGALGAPCYNIALNREILSFVTEGSRIGQKWHILGLTEGKYGFKKDLAQARYFRVLYGILSPIPGGINSLCGLTENSYSYYLRWYFEIY
jgi:hypothetical protein